MSKGFGRVQRAILERLKRGPMWTSDGAYSVTSRSTKMASQLMNGGGHQERSLLL
jgi:hypothetical protein